MRFIPKTASQAGDTAHGLYAGETTCEEKRGKIQEFVFIKKIDN